MVKGLRNNYSMKSSKKQLFNEKYRKEINTAKVKGTIYIF